MMIHWGILGAGNIARRFAESLQSETRSTLVAVAGRSEEKVRSLGFSEKYPCEKIYTDYDEFLNDPEIDAVYLALPHGLHHEWALKALKKGKTVLCENPATLNVKEMEDIAKVSREENVLFMEAMKARMTPIYPRIQKMVAEGKIGEVQEVNTTVCFAFPQEITTTYHMQKGQGGCLLDSGIYCASWVEDFMSCPVHLEKVYFNSNQVVETYVDAYLTDGKIKGRMELGFDRNKPRDAEIIGTKGRIHVYDLHRCKKIDLYTEEGCERIEVDYVNDDFFGEISHFVDLLEEGKTESDIMSLDDSIRCAEILETIRAGFTDYTEADLEILQKQEEILQLDSFTSKDALELGNTIVKLCEEYDNELAIQIVRKKDDLVIFQYIMDSKAQKNLNYIAMKKKAMEISSHSSMYPAIETKVKGVSDEKYAISNGVLAAAGAFPLRVRGEDVGCVIVSGLHEGKDYEIVIRALSYLTKKEVPSFNKGMI